MLYIFDWDGTLSNSLDRIAESMEGAFADNGLAVPSIDERKSVVGLGLREAFAALAPNIEEALLDKLTNGYRKHYLMRDTESPPPLFDGAMDVLLELNSQGHQLAVATGKSRRGLNRIFAYMQLQNFFVASRCADETRSKPHPLMLEEILTEVSVAPEESVMVGDTDFDLLMAKEANIKAVGVTYGAHSKQRLAEASPDLLIDQLEELLG